MSDIEKLEGMYKKEMELYRKHKEKAEQLKMRIDEEKGQAIMKSVKRMNLSPHEFKQFEKALHNESNVRKLIMGTGGDEIADGKRDEQPNERKESEE